MRMGFSNDIGSSEDKFEFDISDVENENPRNHVKPSCYIPIIIR